MYNSERNPSSQSIFTYIAPDPEGSEDNADSSTYTACNRNEWSATSKKTRSGTLTRLGPEGVADCEPNAEGGLASDVVAVGDKLMLSVKVDEGEIEGI